MKRIKVKPARAVHPDDEGVKKSEAASYASYLHHHEKRSTMRRCMADEYALAAVIVQTFSLDDGLVLAPDGAVHAWETARFALAHAYKLLDEEREVQGLTWADHTSLADQEAAISFDAGDTFPDQEALAVALAEIAESIRAEAIEAPKAFGAWQTEERARIVSERAKRRGKR